MRWLRGEGFTLSVTLQPYSIFTLIQLIRLANLNLPILWSQSPYTVLNPINMYAPIIPSTNYHMRPIDKTHGLNLNSRSLVPMRQPRSIHHILLQTYRIPNLDCPVIRGSQKKRVIGGHNHPVYGGGVFG